MQFVHVSFDIHGEQQISRAFLAYEHEVDDLSVPLDRMADVVLASVREQFTTEGLSGLGHPWTPLNPDYQAWKIARYGPRPILVATGSMKGAMLNKPHAVKVTKKRMVYEPKGQRAEIAAYHQAGGGNLPQRKMVALTTAQKREAVDYVFSQWLFEIRQKLKLGGA